MRKNLNGFVADSGPAKVTVQNEPVLAQEPTIVRTGNPIVSRRTSDVQNDCACGRIKLNKVERGRMHLDYWGEECR